MERLQLIIGLLSITKLLIEILKTIYENKRNGNKRVKKI
jgi:hypothetical protein